jgi:hypothetical protein
MNIKVLTAAAFAATALTAASALAYTPYVAPQDAWPTRNVVTVEGASTQTFYQPGVALPGNFQIATPSGGEGVINSTEVGADMTRIGVELDAPGTYRVSTGEMLGQVTPIWDFGNNTAGDPVIRPRRDGDTPPDGGASATYQSVQVATSYVTYGAPSRGAVDHNSDHLVIHPITDPDQVLQANGFQFEVLFNGAALTNFSAVLYGSGDPDSNVAHFINTDANGRGAFTFTQPGRYTIAVRKLVRAPAGGTATVLMYTSTLTFEVMAAAHPTVTVVTSQQRQDRARRAQDRNDWSR